MPILKTDIKLMASERMHDEDDGGGRMTGNEIVDGESNNMFPDVSQLDRTYGRLNLRKIFPAVLSLDTDTYYGSHLIVSSPPTDESVQVTLFRASLAASAWVDERVDAQDKIESYITIGPLSGMRLVGDHFEGQRAILAYQLLTDDLPDVGAVLALNNENDDLRQYVRITSITDSEATYHDDNGDFIRTELMLQISDPLQVDFAGGVPSRSSAYQPPTTIHRTNAIPAVSYFGVSALAVAAESGERIVQVESYKENLLPATQAEEPLLDIPAGNARSHVIDAGSRDVTISQVENTTSLEISAGNRGYTYVAQLIPKPAPGTLEIAFRAQEKWYKLYDESGTGQLTGEGSGSINYSTGSVSVTLAEMPDSDTRIIFGWGSGDEMVADSTAGINPPEYRYSVAHTPIKAGSITITWLSGGVTKIVTDNGTGALSGDGTGWVLYADGEVVFTPSALPDPAETPVIAYTQNAETSETFASVAVDGGTGLAAVTLAGQPVPGTVQVEYNTSLVTYQNNRSEILYFPEAGDYIADVQYNLSAGGLKIVEGLAASSTPQAITVSDNGSGVLPTGSVDYAAKLVTVDAMIPARWSSLVCSSAGGSGGMAVSDCTWEEINRDTYIPITAITVKYTATGAAETAYSEDIPHQLLEIDLAPHSIASVVPGSVAFTLAGHTYWDIEGVMHRDVDPGTGVGTVSGTIDYQTGLVILTDWIAGDPAVVVTSLLRENYPWQVNAMQSYTAIAPVRPGSYTVAATALNGDLLTATAASTGVISGEFIDGAIDVETGIIDLRFGSLVLDSGLTAEEKAEPWYDPANVDGDGYIWRSRSVWPATIRYNCVAYVYLPLSEDILGIDPVRLPMDGRVPIYRVGDVAVIHHTQATEIATPTNGQVVDCGRVRLAWAKLFDADEGPVDTAKYTVDLDAGTVTLDDVAGLTTPLNLIDRIEDMSLVNDVEINGTLSLTKALTHDFPLEAYVSSALIMSDLFARITGVYEQTTWTGEWSDDLIGDAPLASFNNTIYPITVNNSGSTQERWAVIFTSSTAFRVVGEFSGQIALGDVNSECAPINPATNEPYFTIPLLGWGSGWATGNVLRFNSVAANRPIWIARTILQSEAAAGEDRFCVEVRGDVDTAT